MCLFWRYKIFRRKRFNVIFYTLFYLKNFSGLKFFENKASTNNTENNLNEEKNNRSFFDMPNIFKSLSPHYSRYLYLLKKKFFFSIKDFDESLGLFSIKKCYKVNKKTNLYIRIIIACK